MEPKWITEAKKTLGQHEIPGPKDNPLIDEAFALCGISWAEDHTTPWCACWLNLMLKRGGVKGTNSAAAVSFCKWGQKVHIDDLQLGDVVVFEWRDGSHHVAFFTRWLDNDDEENERLECLGGNQTDPNGGAVTLKGFLADYILCCRRPVA